MDPFSLSVSVVVENYWHKLMQKLYDISDHDETRTVDENKMSCCVIFLAYMHCTVLHLSTKVWIKGFRIFRTTEAPTLLLWSNQISKSVD